MAEKRTCTHPVVRRGHLSTCRREARYVLLDATRRTFCAQHVSGPLGPVPWERFIPIPKH